MIQQPNALDGCFLTYERQQHNVRPYIGVVLRATGTAPSLNRVREQVGDRIERMPTLACTVTKQKRRTVWESDPDFDPHRHVHEVWLAGCTSTLEEAVDSLLGATVPDRSPRWGVWLIHGYSPREYALFYRAHHGAQDGQALMDAVTALFGTGPADVPRGAVPPVGLPWAQRILVRAITRSVADRMQTFGPSLAWSTKRTLTGAAQLVSAAIPASLLREAGRALGATSNDICLAALAAALRSWMPESWLAPHQRERDLHVGLPISVRYPEERFSVGNRFSAIRVPLSFWEESATARVAAITRTTSRVRTEGMRRVLRAQLSLPEWLIYRIVRQAANARNGLDSTGLLRIPGRLALGADPIKTAVPTLFLHEGRILAVSFLSYGGQVVVSFTIDRALADLGDLPALWAGAVEQLWREGKNRPQAGTGDSSTSITLPRPVSARKHV
ncbi:wax ester/triacylglycerol synthase domain-containing protein [Streptomyces sp. NPDC058412]|uniref:wax ester/triacylglycerol synthase domain-containing protein n=1 Tax=Streptomyces sp. NPDC058412 TaxID=3346486 RepID=UPI0036640EAA